MFHILLVEDNGGDALLVREAIRNSRVEARVTIAADGEEALRFLNGSLAPDLIILDLNLPKISGFDVLERRAATKGVPVIVFTSSGDPKERERAAKLGVRDYLVKPSDFDEYMRIIQNAVERWMQDESNHATNGA